MATHNPTDHPTDRDVTTPGTTDQNPALMLDDDLARNEGVGLEPSWLQNVYLNRHGVDRALAELKQSRRLPKTHQAAWLVQAIRCIDLTTLAGDDTPGRVRRLCGKARQPLRPEVQNDLGLGAEPLKVGAVCVYHAMVETAVAALAGSGIPVAAVSAGFPAGLSPLATRIAEVEASVAAGAAEIDIVVTRAHVLRSDWSALYDEVARFRDACGEAHLKAILATGELGDLRKVYQASMVAMMAGADVIKTSTGKESENATLPVSLVMTRAIRDYAERTGYRVGFKPAGGIRTASEALDWLVLMKAQLGRDYTTPAYFRFGASSLLGDIEGWLEHHLYGAPAAPYHLSAG